MQVLLYELLPRLFPGIQPEQHFLCIPHEGKHDLERNIPQILRAWREPGVRFVIVRDNDGGNCVALKNHLYQLCQDSGHGDVIIRIVCQELEAWYLGDLNALADAYGSDGFRTGHKQASQQDPDQIDKPSRAIKKAFPGFQKGIGARLMGARLDPWHNRSHSFKVFADGVATLFKLQFPEIALEESNSSCS